MDAGRRGSTCDHEMRTGTWYRVHSTTWEQGGVVRLPE